MITFIVSSFIISETIITDRQKEHPKKNKISKHDYNAIMKSFASIKDLLYKKVIQKEHY